MDIIELILDEFESEGVEAISIVDSPAIEIDFVALKSQEEVRFKAVDEEKRILMGAILVPNKPIYRRNNEKEFYIYFNRETVSKASQMFLQKGYQGNSTLEHEEAIKGLTLVESWIVEDPEMDKSKLYGFDLPKGTWFGAMKVDNEDVWNDYVKTGKVKGFSIEGFFANKEVEAQKTLDKLGEMLEKKKYN